MNLASFCAAGETETNEYLLKGGHIGIRVQKCIQSPAITHHIGKTPDWVRNSHKNESDLGTGFEARGLGLLIPSDRHAEVTSSQHRILNKRKVCRDLQSRTNR